MHTPFLGAPGITKHFGRVSCDWCGRCKSTQCYVSSPAIISIHLICSCKGSVRQWCLVVLLFSVAQHPMRLGRTSNFLMCTLFLEVKRNEINLKKIDYNPFRVKFVSVNFFIDLFPPLTKK